MAHHGYFGLTDTAQLELNKGREVWPWAQGKAILRQKEGKYKEHSIEPLLSALLCSGHCLNHRAYTFQLTRQQASPIGCG